MAKIYRTSTREASILSRIESSKEYARTKALNRLRDCYESLGNGIAMKLVEDALVETTSKNDLEEQITKCLETLIHADDFDIDYLSAPFRHIVPSPHVVTLYVTAYVVEKLINHKSTVDIYGSDEDLYNCIHKQVTRHLH